MADYRVTMIYTDRFGTHRVTERVEAANETRATSNALMLVKGRYGVNGQVIGVTDA